MAARYGLRRAATGLFIAGVLVLLVALYVGLVYYNNTLGLGADQVARLDFYYWVLALAVLMTVVLVGLIVLYLVPGGGAAASAAAAEAAAEAAPTTFEESEAEVVGGAPEATAEPVDAELAAPGEDVLVVRCSNCHQEFEIPYTTERPLVRTCPHCGTEAVLEQGEEVLAEGGVPVIELEGVGPAYSETLALYGITTTEQLRAADPVRLADQTEIPEKTIRTWQAMADLLRVKGIGKQYAELLARAGVDGVAELAKETPSRLVSKVRSYIATLEAPPTKGRVDEKRARSFIDAARKRRFDRPFVGTAA